MPKVNISLPEEVLKQIDERLKEEHATRSEFIRRASLAYIKMLERKKMEREKIKGIEKAILLQDKVREKAGKWNSTAELRKWRERRR